MSEYSPDAWRIIKITPWPEKKNQEVIYKVLAGWYGGYLDGDYWKLNSGITKIEEDGNFYVFFGYSGSSYRCHKDTERFSVMTSAVFLNLKKEIEDRGGKCEDVEISNISL